MNVVARAFEERYKKAPQHIAFTPYRICPIGAHSDHQLGKITGFAINKGVYMAYGPKENGVMELQSLQFDKRAQWHVLSTPTKKENDWADHLRGGYHCAQPPVSASSGTVCGDQRGTADRRSFLLGGGDTHLFVGAV